MNITESPIVNRTSPGIGPGHWDAGKLAREQEAHALRTRQQVTYRLYTEAVPDLDLSPIIDRYFHAYSVFAADGVYQHIHEHATVVEIIGTANDLQRVTDLAGDIRVLGRQSSVLVSWTPVNVLDITAERPDDTADAWQSTHKLVSNGQAHRDTLVSERLRLRAE